MSDDFHDVRFPEDLSYGSRGGPKFSTTVLTSASGFERRNINWSQVRCEYDVRHSIKDVAQMDALINFFMARRGKAYGFRFKDWADYQAVNAFLGTGLLDHTTGRNPVDSTGANLPFKTKFQLVKNYASGPIIYDRVISKPIQGTVQNVSLRGIDPVTGLTRNDPLIEGRDFDIDYSRGTLTLANPLDTFVNWGNLPTTDPRYNPDAPYRLIADCRELWVGGFQFDVPVRFDTDHMEIEQDSWMTENWDKIPLVEVRVR